MQLSLPPFLWVQTGAENCPEAHKCLCGCKLEKNLVWLCPSSSPCPSLPFPSTLAEAAVIRGTSRGGGGEHPKETRKSTEKMTRSSIWGLAEPILGFRDRTMTDGGSQWKEKGPINHTRGFTIWHSSCPVHSGVQGQAAPVLFTHTHPHTHTVEAVLEYISLPGAHCLLFVRMKMPTGRKMHGEVHPPPG